MAPSPSDGKKKWAEAHSSKSTDDFRGTYHKKRPIAREKTAPAGKEKMERAMGLEPTTSSLGS
jgi:hypothetical protein